MDQKWLETCATAGEFLYGFYPVSILKKLYETKKGCRATEEEIIDAMRRSDAVLMEYMEGELLDFGNYGDGFFAPMKLENTPLEKMMRRAMQEGNPYAELHISDDARMHLLNEQEDVDFYIPTADEITELVEIGYIRTPYMTEIEELAKVHGGNPSAFARIWGLYSTEVMDGNDAVQEIIGAVIGKPGNDSDAAGKEITVEYLNSLMPQVLGFMNHISLRTRRGWQAEALFKKTHPKGLTSMPVITPGSVQTAKNLKAMEEQLNAMGVQVDYSSIDTVATTGAYGERRMVKVGRNDPCPCGSGKKYKACHGRR